jgi:hypothetical protein
VWGQEKVTEWANKWARLWAMGLEKELEKELAEAKGLVWGQGWVVEMEDKTEYR